MKNQSNCGSAPPSTRADHARRIEAILALAMPGVEYVGAYLSTMMSALGLSVLSSAQDDNFPTFAEGLRGLGKTFAILTAPEYEA